jgi:acetoin utilization deacetylase AcuC-like enzyme
VQEIFRQNFSAVAGYADKIPSLLDAPLQFGYRTILLVAERNQRHVAGFALVILFPEVKGCWLAGYYCIDTLTPLYLHAYDAARRAVDVALTGARELRNGSPVVDALCRPPGHHAERRVCVGFCYFNHAAAAAHELSKDGRVAVLDIDFHHGNGTQEIFYRRSDVLTVSIHGHPNFAYPYFSGFADEDGENEGKGYNLNLTLPGGSDEARYLAALDKALTRITRFRPAAVVLSAGLDTLSGDPTGGFSLRPSSMKKIGQLVGSLRCPLLMVQEAGYNLRNLKLGLPALFGGIAKSAL